MKKAYFALWLILAALIVWTPAPARAVMFGSSAAISTGGGSCTTDGNDGFAGAPAGAAQFPSLLSSYPSRPAWCVAGVDYAVGITPNATVSGNTITETSVVNNPTNNDKKSFYARGAAFATGAGPLPGGITEGTAYFLCNVTSLGGASYSYTLSTTTACGNPVTLSGSPGAFIALKIPGSTTNTPSSTTGWNGTANCLTYTFTICINGNNATLDHWDFQNGGGWMVTADTSLRTNPTITNNYFRVGTHGLGFIQDAGQDPSGYTISNNVLDGNARWVTTTAASTVGSGSSTITVTSATGITDGMTVCDITNDAAINCNNVTNNTSITISGTTVTLKNATTGGSKTTTGTVTAGDTLRFLYAPGVGGSFYRAPQVSINDRGSTVAQYNYIKDSFSEHWQQSVSPGTGGVANTGLTLKYNLWENNGWGDFTGAHGDVVQIYCGTFGGTGANCSFQTVSLNYNAVLQNTANALTTTTSFSIADSGTYGGIYSVVNVLNNVGIYNAGGGGANLSTYGLFVNEPSWVTTSINFNNNYVDTTNACDGANNNCNANNWGGVFNTQGGPNSPACNATGNVKLQTGAALPKPVGGYC